jgi:hypothetical protein
MKHTVTIIFGQEPVLKAYKGESFNEEELTTNLKNYSFKSLKEKQAFIRGINEAKGWTECCIPELEL